MNIQKDIEFDLKKIAPLVSSELFKFVTEEIKNIVGKICTDNNLEISNVLDKYNTDIVNIGAKFGVKKRNRRVLPKDKQCMGRKLDGAQCTRGRKDGTEYCKSHMNKLPFGRIDDVMHAKVAMKRGRKKKGGSIDNNKYIVTQIETIGESNYLVDDNNFVYSFDAKNPEFLGIKKDGEFIKKQDIVA